MGQKVNPIANRLGIVKGWDSNWYGGNDYGDILLEDNKIRTYLNARLSNASVSRIIIERTLKLVTITICTARPGIIIGKGGQEVDKLKEELMKITDKDIQINIYEIKKLQLKLRNCLCQLFLTGNKRTIERQRQANYILRQYLWMKVQL